MIVKIPCPKNTIETNCNVQQGRAKYEPDQQAVMWRMKKFQGGSETMIRGTIDLSPEGNVPNWVKPPVQLQFAVNPFLV